jgi:tetratricopeptide (TPR) repeat protein
MKIRSTTLCFRPIAAVSLGLAFALALPASAQLAPGGAAGLAPETRPVRLAKIRNLGMQYFEGQKFAEAIQKLEEYWKELTEEERQALPSAYVMLAIGECYYRLGKEENITKAITTWNEYLRRWPAHEKVMEVKQAIAQGYMQMKQWEKALEWWPQIETWANALPTTNPQRTMFREYSLQGQAHCYMQLKKPEDEIGVLERLVFPEFATQAAAEGAVRLMSLYALKHDPTVPESVAFADKAIALLKTLNTKTHLVENFVVLNSLAIKLGDELLDVHAYKKALEAYWSVRPRAEVAKMQRERIEAMKLRVEQFTKAAGQDPQKLAQAKRLNDEIVKPRIEEAERILIQFEKAGDYMPALYFRMARCHSDMNKKWEAIVVFNQILEEYPKAPIRELVIFSRLQHYGELGLAERTYKLAEEYLAEFPKGKHIADVAYIRAATAMRKKDWFMAEKHFIAALEILKPMEQAVRQTYETEVRFQIGNTKFLQNKFPEAQAELQAFIEAYKSQADGKGAFMEDAEYQLALTHLFSGHYQKDPEKHNGADGAIERLQAYLAKWGEKSTYGSDARYRLGVCNFAAYENEQCVKECETWLAAFGSDPKEMLQPEVYALMGDAKAALKQHPEAALAYIESYKRATTDEVLSYSLFEAGKQLQKAGDWEGVEKLYTEFVQARPEHPAAVTAVYWMGKAKSKLGRMEEAKKITIETLQKYIGEPKREGIEMILTQVADWSRRRPQIAVTETLATEVIASEADKAKVEAAPQKWDAEAELERMVKPLRENANETAQYRIIYTFSELAKLTRNPEKREQLIGEIAEKAKAEDLSPHLLMEIGDYQFSKGKIDIAETLYATLRDNFPKADRVDAGWVGLGDVNFARKKYDEAMKLYTHAIDRLGAPYKLKEALLGQAKVHLENGNFTAATKLFQEVAGVREWRGESTAFALFQIAEALFRQKKWAEGTSQFERVALTQIKYPTWAARAYLKAAEGYRMQGKDDKMKERLQELLAKEKLQSLPEAEEAKQKLAGTGI